MDCRRSHDIYVKWFVRTATQWLDEGNDEEGDRGGDPGHVV